MQGLSNIKFCSLVKRYCSSGPTLHYVVNILGYKTAKNEGKRKKRAVSIVLSHGPNGKKNHGFSQGNISGPLDFTIW